MLYRIFSDIHVLIVSLILLQYALCIMPPKSNLCDVKVSIGSNADNWIEHPIFSKMVTYSDGEIAFIPRNQKCPELTMRPERISNVTISKTMPPQNEHNNTLNNDKWYYICVTTVEGIVYYIASQDSLMINSIKSKIHLTSNPMGIVSSLLGTDGSGNGVADLVVNIASNVLQNTDMRQLEALAAQKLIQYIL